MIEAEPRPLTDEERAQLTARSLQVDPEAYAEAVAAVNAMLAAEKAALFAGLTPGVELKPLDEMNLNEAMRFAIEAQTAWLKLLEERVAALEAAREP